MSNQIYCKNLEYPFEIIEKIFENQTLIQNFFEYPTITIKRFLGSNINIDGSGYLLQGKNKNTFSVVCSTKSSSNFAKYYFFRIMYINETYIKDDISLEINIYKNTHDKSTIIEFCLSYFSNNNYIKWVKDKLSEFELKAINQNICENLNNYIMNSSEYSTIYHSFFLNMDIREAYKIFRDFYFTAKVLGVDKSWKIKYENNSIYSVNMNNGICINYHIYKEEDKDDGSKSIFYHKFKDDTPSINEWIKGDFFSISKNKCYIIHETKIPSNINSYLYYTIDNFTLSVLRTGRFFVESQQKSSI